MHEFVIVFLCTSSCFWIWRRLVWNFRLLSSVSRAIYGLNNNPGSIEVDKDLEQTKETDLHIHTHCQSLHLWAAKTNNQSDCWYYKRKLYTFIHLADTSKTMHTVFLLGCVHWEFSFTGLNQQIYNFTCFK